MKLRDLFLLVTVAFWIGVAGYLGRPPEANRQSGTGDQNVANGAADRKLANGIRIPRKPGLPTVTTEDLARHNRPDDCWIAIAGTVYDLTAYIDLHPSKQQEMDGYCGKDGTRAWDIKDSGKDRGQAHTQRAAEFLEEYPQVGVLRKSS